MNDAPGFVRVALAVPEHVITVAGTVESVLALLNGEEHG